MRRSVRIKTVFIGSILALVILAYALFALVGQPSSYEADDRSNRAEPIETNGDRQIPVSNPVTTRSATPHFVSSTPAGDSLITELPPTVTVSFSGAVGPSSDLTVVASDGLAVSLGSAVFNDDRTAMSVGLSTVPLGTYYVRYSECTLDNSACDDGTFSFLFTAR